MGVLSLLLPGMCSTRVHHSRPSDNCTWCERVPSLKHRRRNETKEYHCTQQSPHDNDWFPGNENQHGRTSETKGGSPLTLIVLRKRPSMFRSILPEFVTLMRRSAGTSMEPDCATSPSCHETSGKTRTKTAEREVFALATASRGACARKTGLLLLQGGEVGSLSAA